MLQAELLDQVTHLYHLYLYSKVAHVVKLLHPPATEPQSLSEKFHTFSVPGIKSNELFKVSLDMSHAESPICNHLFDAMVVVRHVNVQAVKSLLHS